MIVNTLTKCLSGWKPTSERGGTRVRERPQPQPGQRVSEHLLRDVLRTHSRGAVEIAFDNENGYIVVEVVAAKICRSVIDIGHEVVGGQRRTTSHCSGKALHAEFIAEPVLCL